MNTVCISTKVSSPEKVGWTKHRASLPLQKVVGHVPLDTHGFTPMVEQIVAATQRDL